MTSTGEVLDQQMRDIAELVQAGPVDLGGYTEAELMVVLGELPAFAAVDDEVLAEAVRSLAARGLLYREPESEYVDIVGDLGLLVALAARRVGALEIRRGHPAAADQPWRWGVSVLPMGVVAIDRVDGLGIHRLSLLTVAGVAQRLAERMIDGRARIPRDDNAPVAVSDDEVLQASQAARARWQLIYRVPRTGGVHLVVDALVLRTDDARVDLITRPPEGEGYTRLAVDEVALREFLKGLAQLR